MVSTKGPVRASAMSTAKRKRKKKRELLLSSTRPRELRSAKPFHALPSFAGRTLIRTHHTLHKRLAAAIRRQDVATADIVRAEMESLGGLEMYQDASLAGQSKERGGDTSGVLVQWLIPYREKQSKLTLLEVGALSMHNACAQSKIFGGGVVRIDLNSRHSGIQEQDFMNRPLPQNNEGWFDVVSLSLVVNFVGDPKGRGEMLRRVGNFLRTKRDSKQRTSKIEGEKSEGILKNRWEGKGEEGEEILPALFLVLPAPCVNNSRYLDEERLKAMLESLGYSLVRRRMSSKLIYYLLRYDGLEGGDEQRRKRSVFRKGEIRKGKDRNNFAIVL